MPHIKVKKINESTVNSLVDDSSFVEFRADPLSGNDTLFAVKHRGEEFLLQLKRDDELDMFKYDKVTRPLKVDIIKEALALLADEHHMDIVTSNITISHSRPALSSKYFKKIEDFESIDFPFEHVAIEVGFGSGRHLLHQAQENPHKLYIGVEIHTPSAQQVLKQIELQNIENIWVVNYDARLFLEMLPSNLCDQIFVHFPVPWDKKPQRRVISSSFVDESLRVLAIDGRLELRTDSDNYFWYSMETFFARDKAEVRIVKNSDLAVTSKYEARWKQQAKDIYEAHLLAKELSADIAHVFDFSFGDCIYRVDMECDFPTTAYVESGYFVHFERVYRIEKRGILIKVAFGSSERPEHKYILCSESTTRYYGSQPVKTTANHQAHQKIMEYLLCPQMSS